MERLPRAFYERPTTVVAMDLIGCILHFQKNGDTLSGTIVETEAYLGRADPASHAYRGATPRNRVMFGPGGFSYVYFTYGNHHCMNCVTEPEGQAGAVLIRAVEPRHGVREMKKRRRNLKAPNLTNGPGKLTQAFGITLEESACDLTKGDLFLTRGSGETQHIQTATRIGISAAEEKPFRFYLMDNPYVSKQAKNVYS